MVPGRSSRYKKSQLVRSRKSSRDKKKREKEFQAETPLASSKQTQLVLGIQETAKEVP
jgi:hypothetical protein